MAKGITAHAHLQPMGDPMEMMPLEAVTPGQYSTRKTSWAGRLLSPCLRRRVCGSP